MTKEQQDEISKINDMLRNLRDGKPAVCNKCGKGVMKKIAGRSYICSYCGEKLRLGEPIKNEKY